MTQGAHKGDFWAVILSPERVTKSKSLKHDDEDDDDDDDDDDMMMRTTTLDFKNDLRPIYHWC